MAQGWARRLSQDTVSQIKERYLMGASKKSIADALGVSVWTVGKYTSGLERNVSPPVADGEQWCEIKGYGGRYLISSHGRVFTNGNGTGRAHVLKPSYDQTGSAHVCLCHDGRVDGWLVHKLVAEAFCGRRPNEGSWIRHVDGNNANNHVSNLEWATKTWDIPKPKPSPEEYIANSDDDLCIDGEIWRPVSWYPERYFISNMGRVYTKGAKGVPPHIMKPQQNCKGYWHITLSKDKESITTGVHRLVATEFCDGKSDKRPDVNHIDGNPSNNAATNLEWVSKSENMLHAFRVLKRTPSMKGKPNPKRLFTPEQVREIRRDGRTYCEIAQDYGVTAGAISFIHNRVTYKDVV